jgi:hypothetical protein
MRAWLPILALAFCSCVPRFSGLPYITDPEKAASWIYANIEYVDDYDRFSDERWSRPEDTIASRQGDCDDMAVLYLAIIAESTGEQGEMVIYSTPYGTHATARAGGYEFNALEVPGCREARTIPYWWVMAQLNK